MTNKEALEIATSSNPLLHGVSWLEPPLGKGQTFLSEYLKCIIQALEKAEKYRWHDLRKNPDDLPENEEEVEIAYISYSGNIFTARAFHEDGTIHSDKSMMSGGVDVWCSWDGIKYCEDTDDWIIPECWLEFVTFGETHTLITRPVIAWRKIEKFNEEEL